MKRLSYSIVPVLTFFAGATVVLAASFYRDVPENHWAALPIRWVTEEGIMTGPGDRPGMFDPDGLVNRAQMATVLTRLHQKMNKRIDELELQVSRLEQERNLLEELLNNPPSGL